MTHGLYTLQTAYVQGDRRETSPVHTSWQGVPYHALVNSAQLLAADAIDNRRRALRRLHRTALTRSRLQIAGVTDRMECSVLVCNRQDEQFHLALLDTFNEH